MGQSRRKQLPRRRRQLLPRRRLPRRRQSKSHHPRRRLPRRRSRSRLKPPQKRVRKRPLPRKRLPLKRRLLQRRSKYFLLVFVGNTVLFVIEEEKVSSTDHYIYKSYSDALIFCVCVGYVHSKYQQSLHRFICTSQQRSTMMG